MEAISIESDPHLYFHVGRIKISEGMKCLQDLVQWYNNKLIPENAGILYATMAYLQSLQRQIQEIESLAQQGEVHVSSNVNATHLQRGQGIAQIREQNADFGPTLNQETEMVMNPKLENTSSAKRRKLKSKVWEDFTKYEGIGGKEWAKCKNCKKDFVGSSKSGTTHLRNHLKSCQGLRNLGGVVDKENEISMIDLESKGSHLVLKIIKYGLNNIKKDILDVYKQEKDKLHRYLQNLPSRFNVTIEKHSDLLITIWFIDDSWELKKMISVLEIDKDEDEEKNEYEDENDEERVKSWLVDWNIDKKICSMIKNGYFGRDWEEVKNICNWLTEQGSLPVIGHFLPFSSLLDGFEYKTTLYKFKTIRENCPLVTKVYKLKDYVTTNKNKFQSAVENAMSKGKTVTSQSVPSSMWVHVEMLEWVMGCKEVFCELEHIDPHFKSINFKKEDWDDATLMYNSWEVVEDLGKEVRNLSHSNQIIGDVCFTMLCDIFFKLVQLEKSDNHYIRRFASDCRKHFDKYWNKSQLVLIITAILDPRFKMDVAKHFYQEIYDDQIHLKKIIDEVTNIYNKYAESTNISRSSSSLVYGASNSSTTPSQMLDIVGTSSAFSQHVNDSATSESELDRYLKDSKCPPDEGFNILKWWHVNFSIYPTLAKIARDFLPILFYDTKDDLDTSSLLREINYLDKDLKQVLACTKVWLNFPVIK